MRSVEHFVSRGAMDIAGFGIRQSELFVELGFIQDLADVYYLDPSKLVALEGFGEKKVANLTRPSRHPRVARRPGCSLRSASRAWARWLPRS